jgi:aspartyl-tRNA(Asn)/glutamyl-tRNA(Gln) amidotransferase subunit B
MVTAATDVKYKVLIGMEIHVELATQSKMFTGAANVAYPGNANAAPNSMVDPVVIGMPGVLPVINKRAVEMSMMVGLGLNCEIAGFTKWDRKSYYYPDLPKNYQISQYDLPLCGHGAIDLPLSDGTMKRIGIIRAHLEEDAGKLLHEGNVEFSQVDLNRAGTPLLEIVTEPDLSSPEEARLFGEELRRICRYLGVTQGIMQQGHMRFEPNINLHITYEGKVYKTPIAEIKNLNSFRAVERACQYEIQRQLARWHADGRVQQPKAKSTFGWDDEKGQTVLQRSKEEANDYRYFPDPDLVPLDVSREWVAEIRRHLVELPIQRRMRYMKDYGASAKEAVALVDERPIAELFEGAIAAAGAPRRVLNLILGAGAKAANERTSAEARTVLISDLPITAAQYAEIAKLVESGTISATASVQVFEEMLQSEGKAGAGGAKATAEKLGVIQVRDVGATEKWVEEAMAANPVAVETCKTNPKKRQASLGFLRGAVMKASGGKADPKLVGELLEKKLNA